jgi:hypothetical protein
MESIAASTPDTAKEGESDIFEAIDIIETIPEPTQENFLLKGFCELAVISIVGAAKIGALDSDDPCDFDFDATTAAEEQRFGEALDDVNTSFEKGGIDDFADTELGQQLAEMNDDFDAAADLEEFLRDEYGAGACP